MKKIILSALVLGVAFGAWAVDNDSIPVDSVTGFVFTDIKVVPTTSVKDQNKSGTCWSFAGTSFLEDEILRKTGKEVDLSEMFTVRHCYEDKAVKFMRMQGNTNFAAGGSIVDVPNVYAAYGAIPEEIYSGLNYGEEKHDHGELDAALTAYLKAVYNNKGKHLSTAWKAGFDGILDAYLGKIPETFVYEGVTYTPESYAKSLGLNRDDYVALTSFTHHPYYKPFILEVCDNWTNDVYVNLPLDEFKEVVDNALDNGYSVEWAADVSEGGFKWREGYAVIPKAKTEADMDGTELSRWVKLSDKEREASRYDLSGPVEEIEVTPEVRQDMFDRLETTDDHGMVIVGKAEDQKGNKYYKVKNSWDTNQVYDGYFYVSEPYFLAKTLSILVNKEALPKAVAKKIKY
ncbi:MAG: aminopeptidase [Duncaniella sp.]|nr:aminopeptidase [Duncaniella sp.]